MHAQRNLQAFRLRRISLTIALLPFAHLAAAQQATLPAVVVKARGEGAPGIGASRVDAGAMQTLRPATSDTASLLRDVPGLSLYGAGAVSSLPAIHGLADDRLRIKVDGMDLIASCPNHMNPALSYLDPSNVGSLSVYAGIAPVSVGGDSIGGTILADTRAPRFAAPGQEPIVEGEVGAFYRSNNKARGANLSLTRATERFSVSYSGAWSQADNYSAGADFKPSAETGRVGHTLPLDEVGSTAYETGNHTLDLAFRGGEHLFEARLGYQDMPYQLYPNQRMDMLDNIQKRVNLRYLGAFGWGSLDARVYHEKVDHFMDFGADKRFWYGTNSGAGVPCAPIRFHGDPAGTCAGGMPMYSEGKTTGASLKGDITLSASDLLRVGGEYQRYRLDDWWTASGGGMGPGSFWNIKDGERDRAALFAEWEAQHGTKWETLLGVRYEHVRTDAGDARGYATTAPAPGDQIAESNAFNSVQHKKSDDNWDLTALGRYTHDQNLEIQFGVARKVRSPNLYERYTWSTWPMAATMNNFVGDGNGYVGNVDLEPEKAHTVSASFDWHAPDRSWEFKATPYYSHVDDYIDAEKLAGWAPAQFNVLQYANRSARLYGVDLSGHMPLARTRIGEWGLAGLLSYTNGKNRDTGERLYNIVPLNAKLTLTHRYGGWNNSAELVMASGKDDVSDVRNEIRTAGYGLVNLRASYSWRQARIDFGIENLFDRYYDLPTGGAYLGQGKTMSMNGIPWGIAVPGMGRSFYVGMNLKF